MLVIHRKKLKINAFYSSNAFGSNCRNMGQLPRIKSCPRIHVAMYHSCTARRLHILRNGFDSRLEPIVFHIYIGWQLAVRA